MKSIIMRMALYNLLIFSIFSLSAYSAAERSVEIINKEDLSHKSGKLGAYRALVIGINNYQDKKIPALKTAVNDARELANVLQTKYGFKVELLLDRQATRKEIIDRLRDLAANSSADESVLIYYAGHGEIDRVLNDGWWVPADAKGGDSSTYLDNMVVQRVMKGMKSRHVLLLSDSCYSGTLFGEARSLPPLIDDKFYLNLYNEKSRWGMTSGNKTPVSDSGSEGHSIFAYQLIKALTKNSKPYITTQEIYSQIAPIIANNSEQQPLCSPVRDTGDQGGGFVFVASRTASVRYSDAPSYLKQSASRLDSDELAQQKAVLELERQELAREKQELERQKALDAEREQLAAERRKIEEERQQLAMGKRQDLARVKQEQERQKALDAEREQLASERRKIEAERQQVTRPASKVTKLNYSTFFPASHKLAVLSDQWCKEIEKRTRGEVQVTMFYGGTLTPPAMCYDGVVKGISDVGQSVLSYTMGKFPLSEILDLPLGSRTATTATRMANDYYKRFRPKEMDDVQIMYLHAHGPGMIHNKNKVVTKLEDLKGIKLRATGITGKVVSTLGATAVGMPMPETYDAISRGIADGVVCPAEALQGWKLGEVVKYTTQNFGTAYSLGFFVAMNKGKWNALSPENRKIIEQVNEEWIVKTGQTWDEIDRAGYDYYQRQSGKITTLTKAEDARWVMAMQPIFDQYVREKTANGLPAQEVLKFCKDRLQELQYK